MNPLADKMRVRAKELDAALQQTLTTKPNVDADMVRAIKSAVLPELLIALADVIEALEHQETLDGTLGRLQRIAKRNNAVRLAAAKGDWDAIDRIVAGDIDAYTGASDPGSAGGEGGA